MRSNGRIELNFRHAINDVYIERLVHDPRYEVRADGTVLTTICRTGKQSVTGKWRQLAFVVSESGHLSIKYQRKHLCIHRVIYRKFHGPLRQDYAVNHIDGDKRNNTPPNLELITHSENMLHCWRVLGHIPMKPRKKIDQEIAEKNSIRIYCGCNQSRAAGEIQTGKGYGQLHCEWQNVALGIGINTFLY